MSPHVYHLTLEWKPVAQVSGLPGLDILLDGTPLISLLHEWENARESDESKKITLGHGPIIRYHSYYLRGWLNEKLSEQAPAPEAKATLLGCACGETGCWPLETVVTLTEQTATWSDFGQPFRPEATIFSGFGPFTFERTQYEAEVRRALANAPRPDND